MLSTDGFLGSRFSSARHTGTGSYKDLLNIVLETDTPADATAAVADMAARSAALKMPFADAPTPTQHFTIPRYPATAAVTYQSTSTYPTPGTQFSVTAVTAHGQYVLAQTATSAESPDSAAQLKAQTFDLDAMRAKGYAYEKLDQLTMEILLGVR